MAGQHWGEHGRPGERISIGHQVLGWTCAAMSLVSFVGQIAYIIRVLTGG
jgi:hypothetical protein